MPQVVEQPQATDLTNAPADKVPAAVTPEPKTEENRVSPQIAALARREKMLLARDRELKTREQALKDKETEYQTSYVPKSKLKERATTDPLGWMDEIGLTPDEFTKALLNASPQDAAFKKLQAEIDTLKTSQNQALTKIQEQEKQAYETAITQIRNEVKLTVDGDTNYDTIKDEGAHEAVVELIKQTFEETGDLISVDEAAKQVEDYLVEEAMRKSQLRKVREKLSAPAQTPGAQTPIKTLSNAVTPPTKTRLTDKERRERALLAFQGKLNS